MNHYQYSLLCTLVTFVVFDIFLLFDISGFMFDATGSYNLIYLASASVEILGSVLILAAQIIHMRQDRKTT